MTLRLGTGDHKEASFPKGSLRDGAAERRLAMILSERTLSGRAVALVLPCPARGKLATDEVLEAVEFVEQAVRVNIERLRETQRRLRTLRKMRAQGRAYCEIVQAQDRPLAVELLATNIVTLHEASGRLRRAEAAALHNEGMTMDQIAELFGVTRQRISELLRDWRKEAKARAAAEPGDVPRNR